jgi:hypothetical protein
MEVEMFGRIMVMVVMFALAANGDSVWKKIGVGIGGGLQKTICYDNFTTTGFTFGGDITYGILPFLEVGVDYSYQKNSIANNMSKYFVPVALDGQTVPSSAVPWQKLKAGYQPWDKQLSANPFQFDKSATVPLSFVYQPIELWGKIRSSYKTQFNPYALMGFGAVLWNAQTDDGQLDCYQFNNYYSDTSSSIVAGEWKDFKGVLPTFTLGFGMEYFPIQNLGIDLQLRGRYIFGNDFTAQALDTLVGDASVQLRVSYYIPLSKHSGGGRGRGRR